jgi:chromate transporter
LDILVKLSVLFAKLSMFCFGGGYVMVPIAMNELEKNNMATASQLTDTVAISTMAPGAVGVNLSVGLGYQISGIKGVIASFLGMTIPTIILIVLVSMFFFKVYKSPIVKGAFYGLRPVITGVIAYAAVNLMLKNSIAVAEVGKMIETGYNIIIGGRQIIEVYSLVIIVTSFIVLLKTKISPIFVIAASGVLGIVIF